MMVNFEIDAPKIYLTFKNQIYNYAYEKFIVFSLRD